jgi:histidinol-phosphate aminotransferase
MKPREKTTMDRAGESLQKKANRFWNKRTASVDPYTPGEQPRDRVFIKLNTNENPYPPPQAVQQVFQSFDAGKLRLYPDPTSLRLRRTIADYFGLQPEQVFVGNGSDEILALAFQAFFEPASPGQSAMHARPVLFPDISYSFYPVYARFNAINWQQIPLNDDFTLPLDQFLKPSDGVVLANPNAPTGIAVDLDIIRTLVTHDHDRLVLLDEAYVDFGAETAVPLIDQNDNLLIVQTCSKSRSLAGLRLGYALGNPGLIEGLNRVRDSFNSYTVDTVTHEAGIAAFAASSWFEQMRSRIIQSRECLAAALKRHGFDVLPSSANFLFVRYPPLSGSDLYRKLRENGILVRHFNQPRIDSYVRVTIGTQEEVDELIRVIRQLLV